MNASDIARMSAIIRCILHIDPDTMTDDEFCTAWAQVKYFATLAYQIKWE